MNMEIYESWITIATLAKWSLSTLVVFVGWQSKSRKETDTRIESEFQRKHSPMKMPASLIWRRERAKKSDRLAKLQVDNKI